MEEENCGIIEEGNEKTSHTAFYFQRRDVPPSFRGNYVLGLFSYAHPDDYKIVQEPIRPDLFLYKIGTRNRLFLRISIRLEERKFMSATFFLDSACCSYMRVQGDLLVRMKSRLQKSDISDDYMEVSWGTTEKAKCTVLEHYTNLNVMGLPMFFLLGLEFPMSKITSLNYDEEEVCHYLMDISIPYL